MLAQTLLLPNSTGSGVKIDTLTYPIYVQPKLNGLRAMFIDGEILSRN